MFKDVAARIKETAESVVHRPKHLHLQNLSREEVDELATTLQIVTPDEFKKSKRQKDARILTIPLSNQENRGGDSLKYCYCFKALVNGEEMLVEYRVPESEIFHFNLLVKQWKDENKEQPHPAEYLASRYREIIVERYVAERLQALMKNPKAKTR
jgi:hypothetical protein